LRTIFYFINIFVCIWIVGIPLNGYNSRHFCGCPKLVPRFPMPYVEVFSFAQLLKVRGGCSVCCNWRHYYIFFQPIKFKLIVNTENIFYFICCLVGCLVSCQWRIFILPETEIASRCIQMNGSFCTDWLRWNWMEDVFVYYVYRVLIQNQWWLLC
jgi:hypothetical protein